MNYLSIYKSIIRRAKKDYNNRLFNKKNKLDYYEYHHVVPSGIGGSDATHNKVMLTLREHFLVHRLLTKICIKLYGDKHPYTIKMAHAESWFINVRSSGRKKYKITSSIYNHIRSEIRRIGKSPETKEKLRLANLGKKASPETKEKLRIINTGKKHSPETIIKMSGKTPWNKGLHGKEHYLSDIWEIIKNDNSIHIVDNVPIWCKDNGYNKSNIYRMASGIRKRHKDIISVKKLSI